MQKTLISLGALMIVIGLVWPLLKRLQLGQLPGDIFIDGENFKFYFPFTTGIVISLVVSLILWLLRR